MKRAVLLALPVAVLLVAPLLGGESTPLEGLFEPGSTAHRIVFELRLPRLIAAALAGAGLALLGGTYQILFHNPLAEPYILGVSTAVTLGLAAAEIFFRIPAQSAGGVTAGFAAAAVVAATTILLYRSRAATDGVGVLALFGMGLQFVLSSVLFLLLSFHYQSMGGGGFRWLFGQIPWLSMTEAAWFAGLCLPCFALLFLWARSLDALSLGDAVARTLGTAPERTRIRLLAVTSAFVSLIVCFAGPVGFVGLVIPHGVRLLFRPPTTRSLFAHCFVVGAAFLVAADILSRTLRPPFEFPVGILTTILGGPLFLYLLWRRG